MFVTLRDLRIDVRAIQVLSPTAIAEQIMVSTGLLLFTSQVLHQSIQTVYQGNHETTAHDWEFSMVEEISSHSLF